MQVPEFQSTLPRGSDTVHLNEQRTASNFNPRSLAGATTIQDFCSQNYEFQSTLPRGSDGRIRKIAGTNYNFNPRSLAGATFFYLRPLPWLYISIHAPSRERPSSSVYAPTLLYFNPRSLAGATIFGLLMLVYTIPFQSTLPRGSDFGTAERLANKGYFNPRSLAGATWLSPRSCSAGGNFNPRSLAGATLSPAAFKSATSFQSTLPRGSDFAF